jgi:hypothetical protein
MDQSSLSALLSKYTSSSITTSQPASQPQQQPASLPHIIGSSSHLKEVLASQAVLELAQSLDISTQTSQNLIKRWKSTPTLRYAFKYLQVSQKTKQGAMLKRRSEILKRHQQKETEMGCRSIIKRGRENDEQEERDRYEMAKELLDFDLVIINETSDLVQYQRTKLSAYGVMIGVLSDKQVRDIVLVLLMVEEQFDSL